ncbi:MAG: GNAT family N-acetyltransferase [Pseudomonadota bacterium]
MTLEVSLEQVVNDLPDDLTALRKEARHEGYAFIERLADEWDAATVRFEKPGEALLVARSSAVIAGIGGITCDPFDPSALRMRRFYVRLGFRRHGVARILAEALISDATKTGRQLNVNAGTDVAPGFWESMGFSPVDSAHHTHIWLPGNEIRIG